VEDGLKDTSLFLESGESPETALAVAAGILSGDAVSGRGSICADCGIFFDNKEGLAIFEAASIFTATRA
jgi:hypothetical protein